MAEESLPTLVWRMATAWSRILLERSRCHELVALGRTRRGWRRVVGYDAHARTLGGCDLTAFADHTWSWGSVGGTLTYKRWRTPGPLL